MAPSISERVIDRHRLSNEPQARGGGLDAARHHDLAWCLRYKNRSIITFQCEMRAPVRICNDVEAWNHALDAACGGFRASVDTQRAGFVGELDHDDDGELKTSLIRTNVAHIMHRRTSTDRLDDRSCFLVLQCSGSSRMLHQGEHTLQLQPGEMMLMDSAKPYDIVGCGLIDHLSIHLDRRDLQRRLPPGQALFGKLSTHAVSGQMLRVMVEQVWKAGEALTRAERCAVREAILALVPSALGTGPHGADGQRLLDAASTQLRRHAEQLIEHQLDNPLLAPAALAHQLGVSLRQLYRLFDDGDTVCRYILRRRLVRSADDLRSPQLRHASITQIAGRWGFTDSAHFSRTFKKQFSCTPRDYRADVQCAVFAHDA
ncbi:transcriptional regulator FeaR [Xanthomonas cassavae CFBP 4642]|uniref:Transcriptional regulator FeaR n=1 Tax=Xanthomonas cassavae CFBP 4642 TaxID=1219375 RepID=A0ABS8HIA1_9XANT|nr:transcriptional regulator FeaR [Xanthomonas cassavae]MCC4621872.1 transcriptional regulator FeaR [Xanthomonas cassavae CFBP 4642]